MKRELETTEVNTKRRQGTCGDIPIEIWGVVLSFFLYRGSDFFKIRQLTRQNYLYDWKFHLKDFQFRMRKNPIYPIPFVSNVFCMSTVTDAGLAFLHGVHTIDLSWCGYITDKGLKHLEGAHNVDLSFCLNITDEGVAHLKGAKYIKLTGCERVTDSVIPHLKGVHEVDLRLCRLITNDGIAKLKGTIVRK